MPQQLPRLLSFPLDVQRCFDSCPVQHCTNVWDFDAAYLPVSPNLTFYYIPISSFCQCIGKFFHESLPKSPNHTFFPEKQIPKLRISLSPSCPAYFHTSRAIIQPSCFTMYYTIIPHVTEAHICTKGLWQIMKIPTAALINKITATMGKIDLFRITNPHP